MGSAGRAAGRNGTRLITNLSAALRRRRLSEWLSERVGRLPSCLSRQASASRDPAALCCAPCLLALLDNALIGLRADCPGVGSLRRQLRLGATAGASSAAIFATAMPPPANRGAHLPRMQSDGFIPRRNTRCHKLGHSGRSFDLSRCNRALYRASGTGISGRALSSCDEFSCPSAAMFRARPHERDPAAQPAPTRTSLGPVLQRQVLQRQVVWLRVAAQMSFRASHAMMDCWQLPRAPRAAAPPRQARRSKSTVRA